MPAATGGVSTAYGAEALKVYRQKHTYYTRVLDHLGKPTPGALLLDLGAGIGVFAKLAVDRGWQVTAVEPSEGASRFCREHMGLQHVVAEDFLQAQRTPHSYSVITMWCVLAHIPEPLSILQRCHYLLRLGGVLFMHSPNVGFQLAYKRLLAAAGREFLLHLDDHIIQFDRWSLSRTLGRASFDPPRFRYFGETARCGNSELPLLLTAKRCYNLVAAILSQTSWWRTVLTSELQILVKPRAGS